MYNITNFWHLNTHNIDASALAHSVRYLRGRWRERRTGRDLARGMHGEACESSRPTTISELAGVDTQHVSNSFSKWANQAWQQQHIGCLPETEVFDVGH